MDAMYYELIILGTLLAGPAHGYLIAKILQNIGGPHGKLSSGRLYPLLAKLEREGLIAVEEDTAKTEEQGERRSAIPSRRYRLTSVGGERFRALMLDTTSYLGDYLRIFAQKVAYFSFLPAEERLRLIDHYRDYCHNQAVHGTTRVAALAEGGDGSGLASAQRADLLIVMRHAIARWHHEVVWADELRAQIGTIPDAGPIAGEEQR
jgi:DNA-binding PadR family transcriptional regulator